MNPLPSPLPVMQAPIGSAAVVELAAAVCEAGGLGCLAASWKDPQVLRDEIRALRAATRRPFCVNLVLAFAQEERLEVCARERVPVVSFSWGADPGLVQRAHEAGALVLVQVGSEAEALAAEVAGADVLIAQGVEAGGHVQGTTPLAGLLAAVAAACPLPLVAA
jgi:NAD(P)H-dependent flavin oxidoreductase YrpB (nitropropane dioxygenase family)